MYAGAPGERICGGACRVGVRRLLPLPRRLRREPATARDAAEGRHPQLPVPGPGLGRRAGGSPRHPGAQVAQETVRRLRCPQVPLKSLGCAHHGVLVTRCATHSHTQACTIARVGHTAERVLATCTTQRMTTAQERITDCRISGHMQRSVCAAMQLCMAGPANPVCVTTCARRCRAQQLRTMSSHQPTSSAAAAGANQQQPVASSQAEAQVLLYWVWTRKYNCVSTWTC